MIAMLYCMAIMRLVNGVVEKTRKKDLVPIAVAADAIDIPRMLIDIQHGSYEKQITKILKSVLRLYSSSSEILSVLLEYLLKALRSSEFEENADDTSIGNDLADWKHVILKLWNKEPELLSNILKAVLDMIETQGDMNSEGDNPCVGISDSRAVFPRRDNFSSLFKWLVEILIKVPSAAAKMPKLVLHELFHKCILISQLCNKQLMDSALHLTELMDDKQGLWHRCNLCKIIDFRKHMPPREIKDN